jgi:HSP20 family molecular chaperone IbpA
MPQEPRSFFQRLTGAHMLKPGDKHRLLDEPERDQPINIADATMPPDEVLDEPLSEEETVYSDEDTGEAASDQEGQLTVDVFQDDQNINIQSTIAGVAPEDLDVSITNDMVTIRGERRRLQLVDPEDYFYQECYWGPFSRSIILPVEIDADRAEAKIKNGILNIRIPKANTAVTRKLKVRST